MEQASAPAAARSASQTQTRKSGSGMGAKLIGGLGAVVTVATVAAFMMSSSPQPASEAALQAATTSPAISSPAPVSVPAPVTTAAVTPPPALATAPAEAAQKECKLIKTRRFFVTGEGSVRVRADNYVSPSISLSNTPQLVELPMLRPSEGEVKQHIVVEGKAPFVILTTDFDFTQGLQVDGKSDFDIWWGTPLKNC
jgi:hypothetical protein